MKNPSKQNSEEKDVHQTIESHHSANPLAPDRTSFNDVIKHGDIINGFQSPKKIEQLPKWYQKPFKLLTIITIVGLISIILYQFIQTIISMITQK
ncbi:hypothetical protein [Bacillus benzoevorans]|uniref:Uncharacterized protein n=1 Tax=Bacillus benzoevorans TaxID=1456 RepID=A0A7X0HVV9_9BACI|nr:hypothetical protein [Bacillus benzoevorans]MBB6447847.1 hypothetical protein [Bacillus benzoevorans]